MSVKRIDPKQTFKIISRTDSALQHENEDEQKALIESKQFPRYDQYLENNFDETHLVFQPGSKPDRFIVRCLLNSEMAVFNDKYMTFDVMTKRTNYKNQVQMMFEIFDLCCVGIQSGDAPAVKITNEELPPSIAAEIGAHILTLSGLGKNEKKS